MIVPLDHHSQSPPDDESGGRSGPPRGRHRSGEAPRAGRSSQTAALVSTLWYVAWLAPLFGGGGRIGFLPAPSSGRVKDVERFLRWMGGRMTTKGRRGVGWTVLHSLWVLPVVLGLGILSWTGLAYVAARTRRPSWLVAAGVAFALAVLSFALLGPADEDSTVGGSVILLTWGLAIVAAFVMLPGYLRWQDERAERRAARSGSGQDRADHLGPAGPAGPSGRPAPGPIQDRVRPRHAGTDPDGRPYGGDLPVIGPDR